MTFRNSPSYIVILAVLACICTLIGCEKKPNAEISQSSPAIPRVPIVSSVGTIHAGHLVGVCAASLVVASKQDYFKDEGLDVQLQWTPNPGDAIAQLEANAIQFWNGSYTAVYRGAEQGAKLKIVAGAGIEGVCVLARKDSGIKTMDDLAARRGKGLKIGTQRLNTIELTMFGALADKGLSYSDFDVKFFPDHFSMSTAFVNGDIDIVSHIEPYASQLIDEQGAIVLAKSSSVWGTGSAECVTSVRSDFLEKHPEVVKSYIRALLRADSFIKANREKALDIMEASKIWKVNRAQLTSALASQPPGVDLTKNSKSMERGISDMLKLGYLKHKPDGVVDLSVLEQVVKEKKK